MPTWPTSVTTTGMDADTDALPRSDILDLATKFNDLIAMRGVAGGVCDLDGTGVIPVARIPAAIARLSSPVLSGTPTAPTAALRTNTSQLSTTAFVLANGLLNGKLSKTAAYTVVAADYGKLIDCTGSGGWTLAIDAVATLGVFAFAYRNSTSGTITIDPNGSETIDGVATLAIAPGESGIVVCDGVELTTVGRTVALPAATASNDGYMTSTYASKLDGIAAGATVGYPKDAGVRAVGSEDYLYFSNTGPSSIGSGGTVAGSLLAYVNVNSGTGVMSPAGPPYPPGTWRNVTNTTLISGAAYIVKMQRIA